MFYKFRPQVLLFFMLFIVVSMVGQEAKIEISGIILDDAKGTIPYASISILEKSKGTSSTEDGEFSMLITKNELQDTLTISSLGFDTFKIKIQDFLALKEKKIILKESVVKMNEIVLLKPSEYVMNAIERLKDNTLSDNHQLNLLYRRAATEGGKSKFFVENFIKLKTRGPAYSLGTVEVTEVRKSADYRIWKRIQWTHSITYMGTGNPLSPSDKRPNLKKYDWKKIGDSSYEGEDVVIVKGTGKNKYDFITFYIGLNNYAIYKIEAPRTLFLYKKHKSGKLHLNYYAREWGFGRDMIPEQYWDTEAEKMTYRLEAFVYDVETDKKKIDVRSFGGDTDMGSIDLPYHPEFWKSLSMPPDTKFFKKIKSELEGMYGVSLETQFELSNK